jgi:hypothetical protein
VEGSLSTGGVTNKELARTLTLPDQVRASLTARVSARRGKRTNYPLDNRIDGPNTLRIRTVELRLLRKVGNVNAQLTRQTVGGTRLIR